MRYSCKNCRGDFEVHAEDFAFYERIKVPPPTWCWKCRLQRRMGSRPGRTLYKAVCGFCKQSTISEFAPDTPFTAYCPACWTSDKWDALSYGRDYDFSKSFFLQFRELMEAVPHESLRIVNSPGSRYCQSTTNCKNCYMLFGGYFSEDCLYGAPVFSRRTVDCEIVMNADNSYESVSCSNIFRTIFAFYADDCMDSAFLFDCKGLTSCFGCVNLRNRSYCIFNKQYSKEEYKEKMKYWDLGSYMRLEEAKQKFREFELSVPHRFAIMTNAIDATGNDIQNTKNCQLCFLTKDGVENCKFLYGGGLLLKDSYDVTSGGDKSQLLYDTVSALGSEMTFFSNAPKLTRHVEYCERVWESAYLFGCTQVKYKQYCILNKQYRRSEYEALLPKIKEQMTAMPYVDKMGRVYTYGEFFPIELSPYAYNESWACENFPMTKEQVVEAGYAWHDSKRTAYTPDMWTADLPDHIKDASASLVNQIIECAHQRMCNEQCTTAFRIIPEEFEFYKQHNIALPRLCPNCRYFERYPRRYVFQLWHRTCAKCSNEFETSYAPDRPEIVYCDTCYKHEFL